MRVVHVHSSYANVGGAERYLFSTLPRLHELGVSNAVLYARHYGTERPGDWPVLHAPALEPGLPEAQRRRDLVRAVRELRPDVLLLHAVADPRVVEWLADEAFLAQFVHGHHPISCPGDSKFLWAKRDVCHRAVGPFCIVAPWLQRCSTLHPARHLALYAMGRRYMSSAAAHVGLFVVASRYMQEELLVNGFPSDRIAVAPPGTEVTYAKAREPERSPDGRPIVLFAGRVTRHKGADLLVRSMQTVATPSLLVIAGDGTGMDAVREEARSLPGRHSIVFPGLLEPDALDAWYQGASVVVVPSVWGEPFGLVGIEAMARERPVVGFDRGAIGEWLDHGVTGLLVSGGDVRALGEAIDSLLGDPELAARMGRAGRERVLAEYTVARHAERLLAGLTAATAPATSTGQTPRVSGSERR
jgi:glycosyltransferase involved in cell wall biosynthesis